MTTAERERIEMSGYQSGRRGDAVCYRNYKWTGEEAAAYRKEWKAGKESHRNQLASERSK